MQRTRTVTRGSVEYAMRVFLRAPPRRLWLVVGVKTRLRSSQFERVRDRVTSTLTLSPVPPQRVNVCVDRPRALVYVVRRVGGERARAV